MRDTSPAAQQRYHALLRERSPGERLVMAGRLTRAVRRLAEAGIRAEQPDATPDAVRFELAKRLYGKAVAERFFAPRAER